MTGCELVGGNKVGEDKSFSGLGGGTIVLDDELIDENNHNDDYNDEDYALCELGKDI